MHHLTTILALLAASTVSSLPLNINLGAYSPALVVGDGEISFGAGEEASALTETLSGASAGTVAAEGATGTAKQVEVAEREVDTEEDLEVQDEEGDVVVEKEKRDLAGFNAALDFATGALKASPGVQLGTGAEGSCVGIIIEPGVDAGGAAAEMVVVGRGFEPREDGAEE